MVITAKAIKGRLKFHAKKAGNFREGAKRTIRELRDGLTNPDREKRWSTQEFSIRELYEGLVYHKKTGAMIGRDILDQCHPRRGGSERFQEAVSGVESTFFANIMGQLLFTKIVESYELPNYQAIINLVENVPTNLSGEKMPGIQEIGDKAENVRENTPYPEVQIGEDWITTPETLKFGMILSITLETLFFDLTGQVLVRAGKIGQWLALNKCKRILDVMIGFTNNFSWRDTTYNTYQTASPWINKLTANPFTGEASMNTSDQAYYNLTDPFTSEPISVTPDNMLLGPGLQVAVRRVFGSPTIMSANNATPSYQGQENPYYRSAFVMSPLFPARIVARGIDSAANAAGYYLRGNFKEAFGYAENWPIRVERQVPGADAQFERDIVYRIKASERGVPFVKNPRYVQLNVPV